MENEKKIADTLLDKEWNTYFQMLLKPELRALAIQKLVKENKINWKNSLGESFVERMILQESLPYSTTFKLIENGAKIDGIHAENLPPFKLNSILNLLKLPLPQMMEELSSFIKQGNDLNSVFSIGERKGTFLSFFLLSVFKEKPIYTKENLKEFYEFLKENHFNFDLILSEENYLIKAIKLGIDNFHILILMEYVKMTAIMSTGWCAVSSAILKTNEIVALRLVDEIDDSTFFSQLRTKQGVNLLHLAILCDQKEVALRIIEKKQIDLNLPIEKTQSSPLYLACEKKLVEVFDALLKKEVDVLTPSGLGKTVLQLACEDNDLVFVEKLIIYANKKYSKEKVKEWINLFAPLISPQNFHKEIKLQTFTGGRQVASGFTALHLALRKKEDTLEKKQIIDLLLKNGAFACVHDIFVAKDQLLKNKVLENLRQQKVFTRQQLTVFAEKKEGLPFFMKGEAAQSSFQALRGQGFFASEIKQMQEETKQNFNNWNQQRKQSNNNNEVAEESIDPNTTFLKRFSMQDVKEITRGSPHCFSALHLPKMTLEQLQPFKEVANQFAAAKGEFGVKKIKGGPFYTYIQLGNEKPFEVEITHQIKVAGKERIYCVQIRSDQKNKATLYLGLIYDTKGLHSNERKEWLAQQKNNQNNPYAINLPELKFNANYQNRK